MIKEFFCKKYLTRHFSPLTVVGVTMDNSRLTDMMENIEDDEGNKLCQTGSEETSCYLLDEGGFIISENVHAEGFSHVSHLDVSGDV